MGGTCRSNKTNAMSNVVSLESLQREWRVASCLAECLPESPLLPPQEAVEKLIFQGIGSTVCKGADVLLYQRAT